jgi:hypothetical protein
MELKTDNHVKQVVEFMQTNIPESKLIGVADAVPQMARLLWGHVPQESFAVCHLSVAKSGPSQSCASESAPALACADGDSGVEAACH